jgi:alpha-1,2-mannosyltransferase
LRARLWQVGLALALFITTAAVMNCFQPAEKAVTRKSAGHDFLAFYTAGTFVRTGRADQLYDLPAVKNFQRDLVQREGLELREDAFGPFWNPPHLAWVFVPLSRLSYHAAWNIWTAINLLCFAGAMTILCSFVARASRPCSDGMGETPMLLGSEWRNWALVPLLTVISMSFIQSLGHGQNTCISLLILASTIALWRSGRAVAAGAVAGVLFYKPQLAAVVAAAIVLTLGWRAVVGLAITGLATLLATMLTLPGTLAAFLQRLPQNIAYMQVERRYLWERHVTLKALWRLLLQGYAVGDLTPLTRVVYIASTLALAGCFLLVIWKLRRDLAARDRLIALTIVTMPLLMPFYFDYDLLLLSAAATLVAREHLSTGQPIARGLIVGWAVLFAWTIVNPAIASATHVNGTVLALLGLSGMMMRQAMTTKISSMTPRSTEPSMGTLRAAA